MLSVADGELQRKLTCACCNLITQPSVISLFTTLTTFVIRAKKLALWRKLSMAHSQQDIETQTISEFEVSPNINPIHHRKTFNSINATQVLLSWKDERRQLF